MSFSRPCPWVVRAEQHEERPLCSLGSSAESSQCFVQSNMKRGHCAPQDPVQKVASAVFWVVSFQGTDSSKMICYQEPSDRSEPWARHKTRACSDKPECPKVTFASFQCQTLLPSWSLSPINITWNVWRLFRNRTHKILLAFTVMIKLLCLWI